MTIQDAKLFLEQNGYYTDSLWSIDDVQQTYECTNEDAQIILDKTFNNEWVTEQIFFVIDDIADEMELVKKEN
jgi:hypothetical protein